MITIDLRNNEWTVKEYGVEVGLCNIDVIRTSPAGLRWNYELVIEVEPTQKGVDGEGNRATGWALPAVISSRPQPRVEYTLVGIGDTILTPYGNYIVVWFSPTNIDHLSLIPVE